MNLQKDLKSINDFMKWLTKILRIFCKEVRIEGLTNLKSVGKGQLVYSFEGV